MDTVRTTSAIEFDPWSLPGRAWVSGDELHWTLATTGEVLVEFRPDRLVDEFRRLHRATDEEIGLFAAEFGVLRVCSHGLPATHNPPSRGIPEQSVCLPSRRVGEPFFWEPLQIWRRYSLEVDCWLQLLRPLELWEGLGPVDTWTKLLGIHPSGWFGSERPGAADKGIPFEQAKMWPPDGWVQEGRMPESERWRRYCLSELGQILTGWLQIGGVNLRARWSEVDGPGTHIGAGSMFGAVALSLSFVFTGGPGMAICDSCGRLYERETWPPPTRGRHNFCPLPKCRKRGPSRLSKRRKRAQAQGEDQ